jgi:hypothetical protein
MISCNKKFQELAKEEKAGYNSDEKLHAARKRITTKTSRVD